jgi:hypothetical protein
MKFMKNFPLLCFLTLFFAFGGCKQSTSINATEAGEKITAYLIAKPESKNDKFKFGELKFNSEADMKELANYKKLADSGYITLTLVEAKKKFLSRDSSYIYNVKLSETASPFVVTQKNDKATVRVINYELLEDAPVDFGIVNDNNAKVTVKLKQTPTPFVAFNSDKDNSEFITKTYKLKFEKDKGWFVK